MPSGHPVRWVVMVVGLVVLLPAVIVLGSRLGKDATAVRSVLVGRPAPDFDLPKLDGGSLRSADLAGKPYVVNFWASWCVPCREEHASLEAFYRQWKPRGVEVVGLIYNDSDANARAFQKELGGDWPLLQDPGLRTALDYGVRGPPETFVVDAGGVVVLKFTGAVRPGALEQVMDDLAAANRFGTDSSAGG
jgi:cytochrome c biogenesis protein CcmG, thiol:disulfide interchange protein DsbE